MASEKGIDVSPVRSDSDQEQVIYSGDDNQIIETKRGLSARHVQLMAIGGSIGTGLWVSLCVLNFKQHL